MGLETNKHTTPLAKHDCPCASAHASHHNSPKTQIRVESTITESNGSSSMASVCGGCLAMLDAGGKGLVCGAEQARVQRGPRSE
jgi:hypothetical protein